MNSVRIVYVKEMLDLLRDRKTLGFVILMPVLVMPLLTGLISAVFKETTKQEQIKTIRIVASAEDIADYERLVHEWFLTTGLALPFKAAESPLLRSLISSQDSGEVGNVPDGITSDPQVFAEWVRELTVVAKEQIQDFEFSDIQEAQEEAESISPELQREMRDFFSYAIKGLGLIEFVDPTTIDSMPGHPAIKNIPERLKDKDGFEPIYAALQDGFIDGYLEIDPPFSDVIADDTSTLLVSFYHDSTRSSSREGQSRVSSVVWQFRQAFLGERLKNRGISVGLLRPAEMVPDGDVASIREQTFEYAGGFFTQMLIVFAFLGGLYPAIDLGAGEKERGTLETLLLTPQSRFEIAFAKFLVIITTSMVTAFLGMASMMASVQFILPRELLDMLDLSIAPWIFLTLGLMILPVTMISAGVLLAVSLYARTFKEAQNYIAPLQFIFLIPAFVAVLPNFEINNKLVWVPLVNVALLSKEFLQGKTDWGYYAITLGTCGTIGVLCLLYCVHQFRRESVLFRT